ncbi:Uncharacterised protein [Vibrio cholerae]|nr:Uncharacterised protein [Vibrio cholerae]CSC47970.1 Uncharacterised protein [Vibrio cholerae]
MTQAIGMLSCFAKPNIKRSRCAIAACEMDK